VTVSGSVGAYLVCAGAFLVLVTRLRSAWRGGLALARWRCSMRSRPNADCSMKYRSWRRREAGNAKRFREEWQEAGKESPKRPVAGACQNQRQNAETQFGL
jgi:hypothetical protein